MIFFRNSSPLPGKDKNNEQSTKIIMVHPKYKITLLKKKKKKKKSFISLVVKDIGLQTKTAF